MNLQIQNSSISTDTGQQENIQEESHWDSIIGGIAETRGHKPNKWLDAVNNSK